MPFCSQCGSKHEESNLFCPACGHKLKVNTSLQEGKEVDTKFRQNPISASSTSGDTKMYLTVSVFTFGGLAIISLLFGDSLGLVLSGAIAAVIYFFGMKKFDDGDTHTAKTVCLMAGIVAGLVGLFLLLSGSMVGAINILVAIAPFMAWNSIGK
ncbi:zinc-ribbon domain-containing protein [Desulfitibacter alkalitolerans]|uniref:zinc-ribbon domain-containing protein n=1 Tax=Desulfitibacter alkalitolerans TaxID=264641 RepID=UPI000488A0E3|nr:zinc ribbon domain-containing protein [Desulfitibacter alkalitolerans]